MRISKLLLSASVFILPLTANATDAGKYYTSITGEYTVSANADGSITDGNVTLPGSIDYKNGIGSLAAIGYYFNDNIHAELEVGYRKFNGDTTSVTISGVKYTVDSSDVDPKALSTMANIFYDIPTGTKFTPYLGAGSGWVHEQDGGANALGYQGMVGVNYKLTNNSTIFTGYRYFATTDFKNEYNIAGIGSVTEKASVQAHAIDVGYRFSF